MLEQTRTSLPADTAPGPVELTVADLERTIPFYEAVIGLDLQRREANLAALGAGGEDVLVMVEGPSARPAHLHAGLYHVALLFSSRLELAGAAVRIATAGVAIQGASDHGTHEAIYLPDPDGIGLELAADRPRQQWPSPEGRISQGGPQPLDLGALLAMAPPEAASERAAAEGLRVGHVHLHVDDVAAAMRFYRDLIGLDEVFSLPQAGFVSAGGYHHHVAFNTWRGRAVDPAPAGAVGLRRFSLRVPSAEDLDPVRERLRAAGWSFEEDDQGLETRDPSGNALLVAAPGAFRRG